MAPRKREEFVLEILELAPGDRFDRCTFTDCEFVGAGPAVFIRCHFIDCEFNLRRELVKLNDCTRNR